MPQLLDNCQVLPFVHRLFLFGKCQGQHGKHRYLPREGFGGCHPYFRSHVDIGTRVRGTGNAGTDGIADAVYKCPTAFGKLHGGQRIGRFSALRDGNHHIVAVNHRVAVTDSLAYSTSTGIRQKLSIKCLPMRAACHDVPHATMTKRLAASRRSL